MILFYEKGRNFGDTTATLNTVTIKDTCNVISNRNSLTVSKDVKEYFEKALELLCKLKTTGINGYKITQIRTNGTYSMRMKADFNSGVTIEYKGKTYDPYSGQGNDDSKAKSVYTRYHEFVNDLGSELHEKNVNYIIWKYAFEPAGFEWGGEWKATSFDPMHFEVKP